MPSYQLRPNCTVEDAEGIAECNALAYWEETWWRLLWPEDKKLDSLIEAMTARTPRSLLQLRQARRHQHVVDQDSGAIVGYARWALPASHDDKWTEAQTPNVDEAAQKKFLEDHREADYEPRDDMDDMDDHIWEWREKYDRDDCLELDYLAVHPDHSRRGVATMLVQSGIKVAAELGLDTVVVAMGRNAFGVFEKAGFELLEKESQDLAPYGEEGVYETYLQIKHASKPCTEMVGVSKRRGGCLTCRARKVKCDGKDPCGPCSVKKRECKPYVRGFIFVGGDSSHGTRASSKQLPPPVKAPAVSTVSQLEKDIATPHRQSQQEPSFKSGDELALASVSSQSSYAEQLISQFVEGYTAVARVQKDLEHLAPLIWLRHVPDLTVRSSNKTLQAAILALSSAGLARERGDYLLLRHATAAYGKALAGLKRDLYIQGRIQSDETLVACLAIILYQILGEYPGKDDWMSHVKGFAHLVRLRGPTSYSSGIAHAIFQSSRMNLVMSALCAIEPSFLDGPSWLKLPWNSLPKTENDGMVDMMAAIPRIVHRSGEISKLQDPLEQRDQRMNLAMECWRLSDTFKSWYSALSNETRTFYTVDKPLRQKGWQQQDEDEEVVFMQTYEFSSISAAHMHMMYWGALLILDNMVRFLYQALEGSETSYFWPDHPSTTRCPRCFPQFDPLSPSSINGCQCGWIDKQPRFDTSGLPTLSSQHDAVALGRQICMSVRYCFQRDLKMMGPYFAMFPLKLSIGCFTAHLPATISELRWCYSVIDLLESKGLLFSRKMLGMYEGRSLGGFAC